MSKAILVVSSLLHVKFNGLDFVGEARHADLGVDGGVGVSTVELGGISIATVSLSEDQGGEEGQDVKGLGKKTQEGQLWFS